MGYIKEVETQQPEENKEIHKTDTNSQGVSSKYMSIAGSLGLDSEKMNNTEHKWLKEIYEWASGDNATESEIISKIITKKNEIGTPVLGEKRLSQFYTWLRCSKEYEEAKNRLMEAEGYAK